MRKKVMLGLVLPLLLGVVAIQAQAPSAIKRNMMVKADMPDMGPMEGYVVEIESRRAANLAGTTTRDTISAIVQLGQAILEIDGKPPSHFEARHGHPHRPGVIHNAKNNSTTVPFKTLPGLHHREGQTGRRFPRRPA